MKIKLLVGTIVSLIGLTLSLPILAASITINDANCASFTTSGTGNLTITCAGAVTPVSVAPTCTSITVTPNPINQGGSATLTANCSGSPDTYVWTPPGPNLAVRIVNPAADTTYSVVASNAIGSAAAVSATVNVVVPSTPPSCSPSASPASITAGQSTQLNAGCTGATSYAWTSSPASSIASTSAPTVSPTVTTTYTLAATNAVGTGGGTVTVSVAAAPVPSTFSCGAGITVQHVSIQHYYDNPKNAFQRSMGRDTAYSMSFKTGPAAEGIPQEIYITEWSGAKNLKNVSLSAASCNYTSTALVNVTGEQGSLRFTVGFVPTKISFFSPDYYPLLIPNTVYYVNLRNRDIQGAETCPSGCGLSLRFYSTIPF